MSSPCEVRGAEAAADAPQHSGHTPHNGLHSDLFPLPTGADIPW